MKTEKVTSATPAGLSERSQRLWDWETTVRGSRSPGRLLLLEELLRAIDQADEVAAVVRREGLTTTTKKTGAVHVHPLVKVEVECRARFLKLARQLHLEWWAGIDGGRT